MPKRSIFDSNVNDVSSLIIYLIIPIERSIRSVSPSLPNFLFLQDTQIGFNFLGTVITNSFKQDQQIEVRPRINFSGM